MDCRVGCQHGVHSDAEPNEGTNTDTYATNRDADASADSDADDGRVLGLAVDRGAPTAAADVEKEEAAGSEYDEDRDKDPHPRGARILDKILHPALPLFLLTLEAALSVVVGLVADPVLELVARLGGVEAPQEHRRRLLRRGSFDSFVLELERASRSQLPVPTTDGRNGLLRSGLLSYTDADALGVTAPSAVASVGPNGGNRYRKCDDLKSVTNSDNAYE